MYSVNGASQVIEHRVYHLGRSALEVFTNVNVCRGRQSLALNPVHKCVGLILTEASVNLHIVELDEAAFDVLWAFMGDFGLKGHAEEGKVVDHEGELIRRDMITQRNLPLHFADLNF